MAGKRLVRSPVFVLSLVRSGSTLLRCLLDSHPAVHAPHELHLAHISVYLETDFVRLSMETLGIGRKELEYMLWDRLLDRLLAESGKAIIVDKTPANLGFWPRLRECWPEARFLIIRRHPAAIAASIACAGMATDHDGAVARVRRNAADLEEARRCLPQAFNLTYEDLTTQPEQVCQQLCTYLGVDWDAGMLDYGRHDHGPLRRGIGDWGPLIRSGQIQPAMPPQQDLIPSPLLECCRAWGYGPDAS